MAIQQKTQIQCSEGQQVEPKAIVQSTYGDIVADRKQSASYLHERDSENVEKENDLAVDIHHDGCWHDNNKHGLFDYARQKR